MQSTNTLVTSQLSARLACHKPNSNNSTMNNGKPSQTPSSSGVFMRTLELASLDGEMKQCIQSVCLVPHKYINKDSSGASQQIMLCKNMVSHAHICFVFFAAFLHSV